MLVVVDTTVLVGDPFCTGTAWRVLIPAATAWQVRIVVPRVVVTEVVNGYMRRVDDAIVGFSRWSDRYTAVLPHDSLLRVGRKLLKETAENYGDRLASLLDEVRAEVIEPPPVSHATIVERAATRRKPCDSAGDGYRDTLNWLSLIELLQKDEREQVLWVSNNSHDFGASPESTDLHAELISELAAIGVQDRLRWFRTLGDTVLFLASENMGATPRDKLAELKSRVHTDAIIDFLNSEVIPQTNSSWIDARACGLPLNTKVSQLSNVLAGATVTDTRTEVRGETEDGQAIVEVQTTIVSVIALRLSGAPHPDEIPHVTMIDADGYNSIVTKPLRYHGLVTVSRFGQPLSNEWTHVCALDDDPGLQAWHNPQPRMHNQWSTFLRDARPLPPPGKGVPFPFDTIPPSTLEGILRAAQVPQEELDRVARAIGMRKIIIVGHDHSGPGSPINEKGESPYDLPDV